MVAFRTIRTLLGLDDWPVLTPGQTLSVDGGGAPVAVPIGTGPAGADGLEVELQKTATEIQWRLVGGTWATLVLLADIKGAAGSSGLAGADGLEVELQKTSTEIQWRLAGGSWATLCLLTAIKGDQGIQGPAGDPAPGLGETSTTAYRGDRGASAYVSALACKRKWLPEIFGSTFVATFASGHGWSGYNGTGGSVNLNDTSFPGVLAAQTIKITDGPAGGGSNPSVDAPALTLNLTGKSLLVWVNTQGCEDATNPTLMVYAGDAGLANYYLWSVSLLSAVQRTESGWICLELFPQAASAHGTPPLAAIAKLRISMTNAGAGGYTVNLGGVATRAASSVYPNGVVSFTFDDSGPSNFALARPTLAKYGYAGTAYAIAEYADDGSHTTPAQYRQMQDELGWEIAGHAYTLAAHNAPFTALSAGDLLIEFQNLKGWLLSNGFTGESWASPLGACNLAVWKVASKFFHSNRTAGVWSDLTNVAYRQTAPVVRPSYLFATTFDSARSVANYEVELAKVKTGATWWIFNLHVVSAAASSGSTISVADLDALAAYCQAQGIAVRTIAQVMKETGMAP